MALVRPEPGQFDVDRFNTSLKALLAGNGLLAITAHVMVPLDADHHHIIRAEVGVTQLDIDLLEAGLNDRSLIRTGA